MTSQADRNRQHQAEALRESLSHGVIRTAASRLLTYRLPDGRLVQVPHALCATAATCEFVMADGRVILGVLVEDPRTC